MVVQDVVVEIRNIAFNPPVRRVGRGTRVTWKFLDRMAVHNVRSTGRTRFRSSATKREGTFSVRFRTPGTFRYRCTIHAGMTGRIVVGAKR